MLSCLHSYFLVRTQRNHINHANTKDDSSAQDIEATILALIEKMETYGK